MNDNDLLDIGEAALFLNVSETSLRRWTNSGALPCLRVGRRRERRFRRGDLLAFMESPADGQATAARKNGSGQMRDAADETLTITHDSHLCGIYGSGTGRIALAVPFLLGGLREGSVCLLYASPAVQKAILKNLEELHPILSSDIREGRLVASEYQRSAKAHWTYVRTQIAEAQKSGATSFRVLGDLADMRRRSSAKELIKYEAGFQDHIMNRVPVSAFCLYDAGQFSGLELLNALKTHRDTFRYPLGQNLA